MNKIRVLTALGALVALTAACSSASTEATGSSEDALRVPSAAEIAGDIAYGQTQTVLYTEVPSFRAYSLAGKQGDSVDLWVRSPSGGDARAWLVRADGKTLAKNDDADASTMDAHIVTTLPRTETYFVVLRDANYEDNTFTVTLAGGGGSGAAIPASRLGTTYTAKASCSFLIEWADFQSSSSTCPDYGYGWGESVDLTFRIEGTAAKPELVANAYALDKVVTSYGTHKTIGWPETRIALDPQTGKGTQTTYAHYDSSPGPNSYCYGVAKGQTTWDGSVSGDQLSFAMYENMQHNTCCSAKRRTATCTLTMP
jgi:hypothetical protein